MKTRRRKLLYCLNQRYTSISPKSPYTSRNIVRVVPKDTCRLGTLRIVISLRKISHRARLIERIVAENYPRWRSFYIMVIAFIVFIASRCIRQLIIFMLSFQNAITAVHRLLISEEVKKPPAFIVRANFACTHDRIFLYVARDNIISTYNLRNFTNFLRK